MFVRWKVYLFLYRLENNGALKRRYKTSLCECLMFLPFFVVNFIVLHHQHINCAYICVFIKCFLRRLGLWWIRYSGICCIFRWEKMNLERPSLTAFSKTKYIKDVHCKIKRIQEKEWHTGMRCMIMTAYERCW